MNCPYCKQEMEAGYLSAGGYRVFWTNKMRRFTNWRLKGDVILPTTGQFSDPAPSAWHCSKCQKVIVDY